MEMTRQDIEQASKRYLDEYKRLPQTKISMAERQAHVDLFVDSLDKNESHDLSDILVTAQLVTLAMPGTIEEFMADGKLTAIQLDLCEWIINE